MQAVRSHDSRGAFRLNKAVDGRQLSPGPVWLFMGLSFTCKGTAV
jgi:hypothetical protein